MAKSRLPGYSHVEHVGLEVPNLDEAVAFFRDVLGAEELYRSSRAGDRRFMETTFDVDMSASFVLAMLRLPPNLNLELFEWNLHDAAASRPRVADPGGHHLCLRVEEIDAAVAHLRDVSGVRILGDVKAVDGQSPVAGSRWTYFVTPWGLHMELVERNGLTNPPNLIAPAC